MISKYLRNEWISYWVYAVLTCSKNISLSSLELRCWWNICSATKLMLSVSQKIWLTPPNWGGIIWLMRQIKREVVSVEGSNSIRRANTETEVRVCTLGTCTDPGDPRDWWLRQAPAGPLLRPFLGQPLYLQKSLKVMTLKRSLSSISYYLLVLCISLCAKGEGKAIKIFILNFIWLWREKKILTTSLYSEGNFIKNVAKEIISFCKVPWCLSKYRPIF